MKAEEVCERKDCSHPARWHRNKGRRVGLCDGHHEIRRHLTAYDLMVRDLESPAPTSVAAAFAAVGIKPDSEITPEAIERLAPRPRFRLDKQPAKPRKWAKKVAQKPETSASGKWLTRVPAQVKAKPVQRVSDQGWLTRVPPAPDEKPAEKVSVGKPAPWVSRLLDKPAEKPAEQARGSSVPGTLRPKKGEDVRGKKISQQRGGMREFGGKVEKVQRSQYARLLTISARELEETVLRNSKSAPCHERLEISVVNLATLNGQPFNVPAESRPQNLVLNKVGIPIEGKRACVVCGAQARSRFRTCKAHASAEPWLPPLAVPGPVTQLLMHDWRATAAGVSSSHWEKIMNESREEQARRAELFNQVNRLGSYQEWAGKIRRAKKGAARWHPLFQGAVKLLERAVALKELQTSTRTLKENLDKVRNHLKEVQNNLDIELPPRSFDEDGQEQPQKHRRLTREERRERKKGNLREVDCGESELESLHEIVEEPVTSPKEVKEVAKKVTGWFTQAPPQEQPPEQSGWLTVVP